MTSAVLSLALLAARDFPACAFAEFGEFVEGQEVAGYRVVNLYLDVEGQVMGARFLHADGMTVDILRVASVPQISLNVGTPPTSDMGESHTQEHLLLGKGKAGQYFNSLISMSLGEHTAATYPELTNYQFSTAGGKETFYILLGQYLKALIRPDYSDEEIRREVAHLAAVKEPGAKTYRLDEKGTVYLEMLSTMEKANSVNWHQLTPLLFGRTNPLARNQGGTPAEIRKMAPQDIRDFHAANYHFGGNLSLIAALPPEYAPAEFLSYLSALIQELEPKAAGGPGRAPGVLPPFAPVKGAPIVLGRFPSADTSLPQDAIFAWKPLARTPGIRERLELSLFLSVLADGDTSVLYGELIDGKTRTLDSGAANLGSYFEREPANVPMLLLTGMPPSKLTEAHLDKIRKVILERIRSLSKAGGKSAELRNFNEKALSLLSSWRRAMLKFIDNPPRFGSRGAGIAWHHHLDELARAEGFRKDLMKKAAYDGLEQDLRGGRNIWESVIRDHRLEDDMIVSAVLPGAEMLEADRDAKRARLEEAAQRLKKRFGAQSEQAAFALYVKEFEKETQELKKRDASIERPGFVKSPPLTLDETIDLKTTHLAGSPVVVSRFPSTPFTDIHLIFDLRGAAQEDWPYLPALAKLVSELGVTTKDGEKLDYVKMQEKWRSEIYGLDAGISANPETGRFALSVSASGASREENIKAVEWLESALLRPDISAGTAKRLRDLLREDIQELKAIFQQREEDWVHDAARAYLYQADTQWMSVKSPFTRLHLLNRLYFRLAGYPDSKTRSLSETVLDDLAKDVGERKASRAHVGERLSRLAAGTGLPAQVPASRFLKEFGGYFDAALAALPEETWRGDLARLIDETKADIAREPAAEMRRLEKILTGALTRANLRVAITGSPKNTEAALSDLRPFVEKFPSGKRGGAEVVKGEGVVFSRLKGRIKKLSAVPVHVALVNNNTKSGVFVLSARGPKYADADKKSALDFLAAGVFSGAAPHSLFMKTWSAGLAYSNGTSPSASTGRLHYYAERCPDLTATMRFVTGHLEKTKLDADFFVDYALANSFSDYRGAMTYSARGAAMAADMTDGRTPDAVRKFKSALIAAAKEPKALDALKNRLARVLGSVLVGYGVKMKDAPGASGFVVGPDRILDAYEKMLIKNGEAQRLIRLYPRDFWLSE